MLRQMGDGVGGKIFELEGHHIAGIGKTAQAVEILIRGGDRAGCYLEGGRIGRVVVDAGLQAQPRCRQSEHAAQLSAANDADSATRRHGPL